jgi:SAM-dependent methyltransferase
MTTETPADNTEPPRTSLRAHLEEWFETDLGRSVLAAVLLRLGSLLPTLFGYHILQLGVFRDKPLLGASRISHQVIVNIDVDAVVGGDFAMRCEPSALPVAADSVDVLLLPYVLEFEHRPHEVLREVDRVLIAEGHVVIVGFNPLSCWGLWRLLLFWRDEPPWNGRFLRLGRLKDWLTLLGFEVTHISRVFYRPPIRSARLLRNLGFMEMIGRKLYPVLGGSYVIVARKRLQRFIPIRTQWSVRRQLIATSLVKPTAFENRDHDGR